MINDRTVGIFTPRGGDKSCARNRDGALKIDVLQNARLDYYATPPKSESAPWIIRQGIIYDSIRPRTHVRTHTWPLIMPLDPHLDPQPRLISWAKHAAVSFSMETKAHCVTEESRSWESSRGFTVPWKALGDEIVYCVVNRKRKGGNCSRPTITPSSFAATSLIFVCTRARARLTNAHFTVTVVHSINFRLYHRHDPACQMKLRESWANANFRSNSCINPLYFLFVLCNPQYLILFLTKLQIREKNLNYWLIYIILLLYIFFITSFFLPSSLYWVLYF